MEKLCTACGSLKPITEFYADRTTSDRRSIYCKDCFKAKQREYQMRPPKRTPPPGLKWCQRCKQDKPILDFYATKGTYDGLNRKCKDCTKTQQDDWRRKNLAHAARQQKKHRDNNPERHKDYGRKARYGLHPGQFDAMLAAQGGRCAICRTDTPTGHGGFHVDHCHETNVVRGILCHGCNVSIGHFKHEKSILLNAINYLENYASKVEE